MAIYEGIDLNLDWCVRSGVKKPRGHLSKKSAIKKFKCTKCKRHFYTTKTPKTCLCGSVLKFDVSTGLCPDCIGKPFEGKMVIWIVCPNGKVLKKGSRCQCRICLRSKTKVT